MCSGAIVARTPVALMTRSAVRQASTSGATSKPSWYASSAANGSTSEIVTRAPRPLQRAAMPLPTQP